MKSPSTINVAIAEDHSLVREGIVNLLNETEGIQVILSVANGQELLEKLSRNSVMPDVCILDINMPKKDGFETLSELKTKWNNLRVLVLTAHAYENYLIRMIQNGANGYLLKNCSVDELTDAINLVHWHGAYYPNKDARIFANAVHNQQIKLPIFTASEEQVIKYSCTDLTYEAIAKKIGTTTKSVEGHRDNIFRKLGISSRTSLALFAVQYGYINLETPEKTKSYFLTSKNK